MLVGMEEGESGKTRYFANWGASRIKPPSRTVV